MTRFFHLHGALGCRRLHFGRGRASDSGTETALRCFSLCADNPTGTASSSSTGCELGGRLEDMPELEAAISS